ncbi:MAG TPA: GUN4 domain-containing protein [Nostocaceae cyanobacterium]|nr:GUN4 domain-containing protein [Nostocaceae cyanobacterium]
MTTIDLSRLHELLLAQNWQEADKETGRLIIRTLASPQNYISAEMFKNIPQIDKIDQLWTKYSDGRFGFSVQKEIYCDLGGKLDSDSNNNVWISFGNTVNWRNNDTWIRYDEITFDQSAVLGHLPVGFLCDDLWKLGEIRDDWIIGGGLGMHYLLAHPDL